MSQIISIKTTVINPNQLNQDTWVLTPELLIGNETHINTKYTKRSGELGEHHLVNSAYRIHNLSKVSQRDKGG